MLQQKKYNNKIKTMRNTINFCFILLISVIISCNSESEGENIIDNNNMNKEKYETLKSNLKDYLVTEAKTDQLEEYIIDNKSCFTIKYPFKMLMLNVFNNSPRKVEVIVKSEEELLLPFIFGGSESIIYPIVITNKKGEEIEVKNAAEFDKHYNECKGIESCIDCKRNCFKLSYPLRFVKDSRKVKTINSNKELDTFLNNLQANELFKLSFPLNIY